jgi:acetyl-CoA acyltransferase 1
MDFQHKAAERQRILVEHLRSVRSSQISRPSAIVWQQPLTWLASSPYTSPPRTTMQAGIADYPSPSVTPAPTSAGDSAAYERRPVSLDDVVIVSACRTALTKAKRGGFRDTPPDDLVAAVLKETIRRSGVEPEAVGDVVFGSVLGPSSQRANECRMAMFYAGFPESVPVQTVNRQCSSGLQAIASVASAIRAGFYEIGIAGGVESMTANPMAWEGGVNPRVASCPRAGDCLLPMGLTSENVAAKYNVNRQVQDAFAAKSHAKAAAAQAGGKFKDEIVPVETVQKDPKTGEERRVVIDQDDGIRPGTTAASLGSLRPAFKKGGTTTAGNSSQVTDGAAAVMLMTRREALRRGLPILLIFRSFSAVGVPPAIMGVGPAVAIPAAVKSAGLTLDDIDVFEINEAFASQAKYSVDVLGIDEDKVNPNGGAIAIGHPLGCTGARQTATLAYELLRRGKAARFGVVSMCIGSGMGAAAVFERGSETDDIANARAASSLRAGLSKDARV